MAGRNPLAFASLSAGVTPQAFNRGTQFGAAGSSRSQYVTVEGGRDSSTNYAIDGVYVRSLRFNNLSLNPPLDAVQEVAILRNSFTTEYGQGQAVVSMVTKSGSNSITGSAYTTGATTRSTPPTISDRNQATRPRPALRPAVRSSRTNSLPSVDTRGFEPRPTVPARQRPKSDPAVGGLLGARPAIKDPLTGLPFPGNVIPSGRFSNFAKTLGPTVPAPNAVGANN